MLSLLHTNVCRFIFFKRDFEKSCALELCDVFIMTMSFMYCNKQINKSNHTAVSGSVMKAGNSINMDDRNFILHYSGQFHRRSALGSCIICQINKSLICAGKYVLSFSCDLDGSQKWSVHCSCVVMKQLPNCLSSNQYPALRNTPFSNI